MVSGVNLSVEMQNIFACCQCKNICVDFPCSTSKSTDCYDSIDLILLILLKFGWPKFCISKCYCRLLTQI